MVLFTLFQAEDYDTDFHEDKIAVEQQIKQEQVQQSLEQQQRSSIEPVKFPPDPSAQIIQSQISNAELHQQPHLQSHLQNNHLQQHPHLLQQLSVTTSPQTSLSVSCVSPGAAAATPSSVDGRSSTELKLSRPTSSGSYSYGILASGTDYGMSGTPPHDPEYPAYQTEYPSNVK